MRDAEQFHFWGGARLKTKNDRNHTKQETTTTRSFDNILRHAKSSRAKSEAITTRRQLLPLQKIEMMVLEVKKSVLVDCHSAHCCLARRLCGVARACWLWVLCFRVGGGIVFWRWCVRDSCSVHMVVPLNPDTSLKYNQYQKIATMTKLADVDTRIQFWQIRNNNKNKK